MMTKIILVWPTEGEIAKFQQELARSDVEIIRRTSGAQALNAAGDRDDIVLAVTAEKLTDMSGINFAERLLAVNAMIGCAVASSLAADDFHEESEGLGILMQLPPQPTASDGVKLLAHLTKIGQIAQASRQ